MFLGEKDTGTDVQREKIQAASKLIMSRQGYLEKTGAGGGNLHNASKVKAAGQEKRSY